MNRPTQPLLSPIVAGLWRMADWNLDVPARVRWIEQALDLGIDCFDHADIYGGGAVETLFGEALDAAPALRDRIRIVTKCGIRPPSPDTGVTVKHYDTSACYVRTQVEASLRKLGVERLHLVLIHRPDALMDADALAGTFAALTEAGKVAHWGVSNHAPSQFALLHDRHPLATNQVELSPLYLEPLHDGTLDQAQHLRLRPMIWSPLGGGRLFSGEDDRAVRVRAAMQPIAERLACRWPPWPTPGCCGIPRDRTRSREPRGSRACARRSMRSDRSARRGLACDLERQHRPVGALRIRPSHDLEPDQMPARDGSGRRTQGGDREAGVQPGAQPSEHAAARRLGLVEDLVVEPVQDRAQEQRGGRGIDEVPAAGDIDHVVVAGRQQQGRYRQPAGGGDAVWAGAEEELGQARRDAVVAVGVPVAGRSHALVVRQVGALHVLVQRQAGRNMREYARHLSHDVRFTDAQGRRGQYQRRRRHQAAQHGARGDQPAHAVAEQQRRCIEVTGIVRVHCGQIIHQVVRMAQ